MTFEEARNAVNARPVTDFYPLQKSKNNQYVCPICGSGTGKHKTGALHIFPNNNRVFCFSGKCFTEKGEDTAGALAKLWGCSLIEALKRATGQQIDVTPSAEQTPARKLVEQPKQKPQVDYTEQYKAWHRALMETPEALDYMHSRGIEDRELEFFLIGYSPAWAHSTHPEYKSKRIIFPRTRSSYSARKLADDGDFKYQIEGKQEPFNVKALENEEEKQFPFIVVEGEIDCMAVHGVWGNVVALGTISNAKLLIDAIKERNQGGLYILALDADEPGQKAQKELEKELTASGVFCISADTAALYAGAKDAAEAAQKDKEGFYSRIIDEVTQAAATRQGQEAAQDEEAYSKSGAGAVDSLLQEVKGRKYEPISSGIKTLDKRLGGGFTRQSVVLVAACPGMGKTGLLSQIAESMAKNQGLDCLYFNLEMSRQVMLARSLARIANTKGANVSVTDILRGYEWSKEQERIITEAAEEYKRDIAPHINYNPHTRPGESITSLDVIMRKIQEEQARLGHAPVVFLDYMQLVKGEEKQEPAEVIKDAMQRLKDYANDNKTLVFAAVATNRQSGKDGKADLFSGRDTSGLEFGADVHIGLEYAAASGYIYFENNDGKEIAKLQKGKDGEFISALQSRYIETLEKNTTPPEEWKGIDQKVYQAYLKYCRAICVKVNKNRLGYSNGTAKLLFDGKSARFMDWQDSEEIPGQQVIDMPE